MISDEGYTLEKKVTILWENNNRNYTSWEIGGFPISQVNYSCTLVLVAKKNKKKMGCSPVIQRPYFQRIV